jgi:uncharacterized protein (UPF0335 family)
MPRKKENGAPTPAKTNGYDAEKTQNYVARLEALHADIASRMAEARNDCKAIHADIKEVYQEAKDEIGIPKKALRSVIRVRLWEYKTDRIREELDPDTQNDHDLIRHALGDLADTPLGQVALGKIEQDIRG